MYHAADWKFMPKEDWGDQILCSVIVVALVLIAGLMSGLTLGLLSISKTDIQVLLRSGTPIEKERAGKIEPVLRRPHLLLVTLVLCNAAATEALPIFLDRLLDPVSAVILSIAVVLIFGEIIPQSVCTRYGLAVGASSAWLVKLLMIVCGVISWPISRLLDWVLGAEHESPFRRAQLKALVSIHSQDENFGGNLRQDEVAIIRGALELNGKTAAAVMTPLDNVFMLSADAVLDEPQRLKIHASGHSRIPVHRADGGRHEIIGLLLVKDLIVVNPDNRSRAGELRLRGVPFLQASTNLFDILHLFESGRCHMAVLVEPESDSNSVDAEEQLEEVIQIRVENENVDSQPLLQPQADMEFVATPQTVVGIITLEDILEAIIQAEIVDETDQYVDNEGLYRVDAAQRLRTLPPHLRRLLLSRKFLPRVGPPRGAMLASKETQEKIDMKISAYRAQAAQDAEGGPGLSRQSGRTRRIFRSDDGTPKLRRSDSDPSPGESLRRYNTLREDDRSLDLTEPLLPPGQH